MAAVDLTKIALLAVVDVNGNWGYAPWNAVSGIRIDPGIGTGTFIGATGKVYTLVASDPSAKAAPSVGSDSTASYLVTEAGDRLEATTYQPNAGYQQDAPYQPDATS